MKKNNKRINIFLGGFVNYINAQNLNCRAIALELDKNKFNVYTLELTKGQLPALQIGPHIHVFRCFRPLRLSLYLGFLWGIWNCDIAYLPKSELWRFNRFVIKILKKRSFTTIEGILDDVALNSAISTLGSLSNYIESLSFVDKRYSITEFMQKYNFNKIGVETEREILYLGVNTDIYISSSKSFLANVLMIGNDLVRKGIYDYLEVAANFPDICFYIAGSGNGYINVDGEINARALRNVIYKGMLSSDELRELLNEIDLHILPSRSEGFPKVTLETAAAGVPSIVYSDYGAEEWISTSINGWVVQDINDIINIVRSLQFDSKKLRSVSEESIRLAGSFDWKTRIKDWETVIEVQMK